MALSLRRHLHEAVDYMRHTHGYRTILPTREPPAPVRIDERNLRLVYAVSVILVVERYDRTGYAMPWLMASEDVAGEEWDRIPEWPVCPLCLGRVGVGGKGRVPCVACGTTVLPKTLRGMVSADLARMARALRAGLIPVEWEG